ncbi:MAG: RNA polymerase sigma factor [Bacilli bacterium]|nr:RNA polymerase sigma factor [Bacilli bacterium]
MDREYFENLIDKYSDILFRCAFSYCKNKSDAEDIVQETFIKYLRKKPNFNLDSEEKAWLLRVTINMSKDLLKTYWHKNRQELTDIPVEFNDNSFYIFTLISKLPSKYRIVIHLYYQEGYKIKEISQILKLNTSTVGNRLARAKKILKKYIEEENYE